MTLGGPPGQVISSIFSFNKDWINSGHGDKSEKLPYISEAQSLFGMTDFGLEELVFHQFCRVERMRILSVISVKCMRTRNSKFSNNSPVTILIRRNRRRAPNVVEPELRTIVEVAPMVERTMEELLRAPTEGYGEAIVIPKINADHFEIKTNLLQLVQASPFHGFKRETVRY
ncbi:hypothetical protein Tco_0199494 [Tanacetum coccineum]